MIYEIGYGFGRGLAWLFCVAFVYAFVLAGMSRESRRRQLRRLGRALGLVLWALVAALPLAVLWVVGRFDGIEDRRRDWQLAHAEECRVLARTYRSLATHTLWPSRCAPKTVAVYVAHANQLDRLADMFADDAAAREEDETAA